MARTGVKQGGIEELKSGLNKIEQMKADDPDVDLRDSDDPQVRGALDFARTLLLKESKKEQSVERKLEVLREYLEYAGTEF